MKRLLFVLSIVFLFVGCASVPQSEHNGLETDKLTRYEKSQLKYYLFSDYVERDKISYLKPKFDEIETYGDLERFYKSIPVDDAHLWVYVNCKCGKSHIYINAVELVKNDPYFYSEDPVDTRKYISTSNTEYIRLRVFDDASKYSEVLNKVKLNKDFLVLDFRTNGGGRSPEFGNFLKRLEKYRGQVIIIQDNYTASAGEFPAMLSLFEVDIPYILIGTNSSGCVSYGDCGTFIFGKLEVCIAHKKRGGFYLKRNFLGEGRGYAPDIYVNRRKDLYPALEKLGVDITGIWFD